MRRTIGVSAAGLAVLLLAGCKSSGKPWKNEDYVVRVTAEGAHTENVIGVVVALCADDCQVPSYTSDDDVYNEVKGQGTLARKLGTNAARYSRRTLYPTGPKEGDRSFDAQLSTRGIKQETPPKLVVVANLGKGKFRSASLDVTLEKENPIHVVILAGRVEKR
jgi:hypothetical protein